MKLRYATVVALSQLGYASGPSTEEDGFAVSIVYNAVGLTYALSGHLTPLASAVLMPVSSITVIALSSGLVRFSARRMLPA